MTSCDSLGSAACFPYIQMGEGLDPASSGIPASVGVPSFQSWYHFPGMETSGGLLGVGWPLSLTSLNFLVLGSSFFYASLTWGGWSW